MLWVSRASSNHTPLRNLRLWEEEYRGILWLISEFLGRWKEPGFQFSALSVRLWSSIPLFLYFPLLLLNKKRHKLVGWLLYSLLSLGVHTQQHWPSELILASTRKRAWGVPVLPRNSSVCASGVLNTADLLLTEVFLELPVRREQTVVAVQGAALGE